MRAVTDLLRPADTDLVSSLLFLLFVLLLWVCVGVPVLLWERRDRPERERSLAADEPSGPLVALTEIFEATGVSVVDRRHPEPWWNGNRYDATRHHIARRPHPYTGVVCDKTQALPKVGAGS